MSIGNLQICQGYECPCLASNYINSLYVLRCLYDKLCGGHCEQWRNNWGQWVFVLVRSQRPLDWNFSKRSEGGHLAGLHPVTRCRLNVAVRISIFRPEFVPFAERIERYPRDHSLAVLAVNVCAGADRFDLSYSLSRHPHTIALEGAFAIM